MDGWKPGRSRIEVVVLVKAARLFCAGGEFDIRAAAEGPVAAAASFTRLDQRTSIAGLAQFVRRDKTSDPGSQNDNAGAFSIDQSKLAGFCRCLGDRQQAERLLHDECGSVATHLAHTHQKLTSGETHFGCFPL